MRSLVAVLLVAGCAAHPPAAATPDYTPVALQPASPHAALYADCLADAVANHRVAQAEDATTTLLVFTCRGEPARAFYDGLAEWAARDHSEFVREGRTLRSTTRVRHDLFGVDYCAADECTISLNAGDFVR